MTSGGARVRSGRAKDPNSFRSAASMDAGEWRVLPADGPDGDAPACPLVNASAAELEMWSTYWRKPQAVVWSEYGMEIEVALHVRHLVESLRPDAPSNARTLVRQQMDSLLLTHKSMQDAKLRISTPDVPSSDVTARPQRMSARERRLAAVADVT